MAINTYGYTSNGASWKQQATSSVTKQGKQTHSEVNVYNALGAAGKAAPYLILQNAFPCSECDGKFTTASARGAIVFKITADEGKYAADHGLGQAYGTFPTYIWYLNGAKTISTALAGKPATFPVCPSADI